MRFSVSALALVALIRPARSHMSMWSSSMYGVGANFSYDAGNPIDPIGPNVLNQNDWWFRGPEYRALAPPTGEVTQLPAGGKVTIEMSCHVAWTSFGARTTVPGSPLDACPGPNTNAYHSGDPTSPVLDDSLISGCALGIAQDVEDVETVGWDDLVIFSVQKDCVKQKMTTFEIPAMMPKCKGEKCICSWFWLANNGTANFYMTAFDCNVTNSSPLATHISAPIDPVFCPADNTTCTPAIGAKRPLYAYNQPTNVIWEGNNERPGYHSSWSFNDGAQNDIFEPAVNKTVSAPIQDRVGNLHVVVNINAIGNCHSAVDCPVVAAVNSQVPNLKCITIRYDRRCCSIGAAGDEIGRIGSAFLHEDQAASANS